MNPKQIEKQLLTFQGSEKTFPFGPEAMVFKVMGKMFALLMERDTGLCINLKGHPEDNAMLVKNFAWAQPGYHMNKRHWVTLNLDKDVPEEMLSDLMADSYDLIVKKLTRAKKEELSKLS